MTSIALLNSFFNTVTEPFGLCRKQRYYTIQGANNKGADQTARMRRLICAFVVRIWHKTHFRMTWLILSLIYSGCVFLLTRLVFIGACLSKIVKKTLFQAEKGSFHIWEDSIDLTEGITQISQEWHIIEPFVTPIVDRLMGRFFDLVLRRISIKGNRIMIAYRKAWYGYFSDMLRAWSVDMVYQSFSVCCNPGACSYKLV